MQERKNIEDENIEDETRQDFMEMFNRWAKYLQNKCREYSEKTISQATLLVIVEESAKIMREITVETMIDAIQAEDIG